MNHSKDRRLILESMNRKDPIMSLEESASYLCMSTETIKRMARDGSIARIKYGRKVSFRLSHLNNWIEKNTQLAQIEVRQ